MTIFVYKKILLRGKYSMSKEFNKITSTIENIATTSPSIYEDALQPTVKEIGKFTTRVPRAINAAFSGLDKWILNKEYSIDETKKLLAQKLKNVEPAKIIEPEAYIAIPAIQAISYSMNSKELRNLYANLIAKAMNFDTKNWVHPSFVEIIKQMSPIDADIFKIIYETKYSPLIDLSIYKNATQNGYVVKNISWITSYDHLSISLSLDNLARLMLIDIQNNAYSNKDIYNLIKTTDYYIKTKNQLQMLNPGNVKENLKFIQKTYLSLSFYKVCVQD